MTQHNLQLVLLVGVCVAWLGCVVAQSPTPAVSADAVPFCDEVDTHPSSTDNPNDFFPPDNGSGSDDNGPIANAQEYAGQLSQIANELLGNGANASALRFGEMTSRQTARMSSLLRTLASRQKEIDELYSITLPAIESSIKSRRARAQIVREEIRAMNEKLRKLVESLDRSTYVQEQQAYMTIIDILTRVQNSIEMKMLNSERSYSPVRTTETHPTALVSVHQEVIPTTEVAKQQKQQQQALVPEPKEASSNVPAKEGPSPDLDMLNALDLLEVQSESDILPYQRRMNLLLKRIQTVLSRLIAKFSEMRQKHKEYAKANREIWGKQIDLLQQQSDDLSGNLEEVMEQSHFYLRVYNQHADQLHTLISEQERTHHSFEAARQELLESGIAFTTESQLRASQLRKIQELSHYLLYPNQTYSEEVFAFACDGVVGGSALVDGCGVCGGSNMTCRDCNGVVAGIDQIDICGECGGLGRSCSYFCSGGADSGILVDLCGECGGNGTICMGCDGVPHSGVVYDSCGVCGGDGTTCSRDNTPQTIQLAIAGETEILVITKIRFASMAMTPEWTSKYGDAVRNVVATITQTDLSKVYLMLAEGSDSVVVSIGLGVPSTQGSEVASQISRSVDDNSFVSALAKVQISSGVQIVQGPSLVHSP